MKQIYFDAIAGTPIYPEVWREMEPFIKNEFGNPQSLHSFGEGPRAAIEKARERIAKLIGANKEEIYFTSSGSEANNFAIKGLAFAYQNKGKHIILSSIEHQSILNSAKFLEKLGFKFSYVPVDKYGIVDPDDVRKFINKETILVSVMLANSEIGTIQPIEEIARICHERDVLFHTDAVGGIGYLPIDVSKLGVDSMSLSATQMYGPKGVGALYLRKGTRIIPLIHGGIQEEGKRAGTENVAGIVGFGKAAELALEKMEDRNKKLIRLRDKIIAEFPQKVENVYLTGHPKKRLPYHSSFCVEYIEGEAMLLSLNMKGIAASSGSACTSRTLKASHVLLAMGYSHALAQGSIVFSFIEDNKEEEIDYLLEVFPPIIKRLREMSPLYNKQITKEDR
ncbi:IscS subfamily cysteine desulfurase [SCandidatus Aminicenantes bacterium Aminicenantia_JdfR_composite]|jgi:cysteine desulfurase|nr:IscS subfamily cysteine desulfurase [SCandidatus Aminicenantes bacterium Aminicenantia_JdfR_composite]MCP2620803.1 IscS subfamily cysteine desulfurase [Candidatus Aminicenantes bacterium AC-334-E05]